ncbi:hypothetical protein R5N98_05170 [Tenacibaculum maritimum]|nr:hypothetical protein [Tenacibaculum maritimum]MCD9581466.1 hypothetical protein [Tenacibaculum maritimum]MCD9611161.1 hypothetical protein [Tenacibaculum maritimum]MCD9635894.1 hypothetical protein [Tenacibaculum maritimum]CAA0147304.1 conserved hypothetical protein [Tenacibaculum maritimum]CAA0159165.1 conserved hypothetical protein [Tenacibaculum maritimum]
MSYKNFASISNIFDKTTFYANEKITGKVSVKNNSTINLKLEHIQISLILKHHGKGETDSILLNSFTNHEYKEISRGQSISIPFSFSPIYNVTFNGINVSQSILIKTKVDITNESEKLLRNHKLSNFKIGGYISGLISPDFFEETPIIIAKGDSNYELKNATGLIQPGMENAKTILIIGLSIIATAAIIFYISTKNTYILIALICSYGLLTAGIYHYKIGPSKSIGPINFKLTNQDNDSYQVHLRFQKRTLNIQKINYQLIGQEMVTYDNGSNRSTALSFFFKSKINRILLQGNSAIDIAPFPKKSLPTSISNNDFDITWLFKIIIVTKNNITIEGKHIIDLKYQENLN